jgi:hypothetical protein
VLVYGYNFGGWTNRRGKCGMSIHRPAILVANNGIQTSTWSIDLEGGTSQGEDMRR